MHSGGLEYQSGEASKHDAWTLHPRGYSGWLLEREYAEASARASHPCGLSGWLLESEYAEADAKASARAGATDSGPRRDMPWTSHPCGYSAWFFGEAVRRGGCQSRCQGRGWSLWSTPRYAGEQQDRYDC
jgi:hypothetical protein